MQTSVIATRDEKPTRIFFMGPAFFFRASYGRVTEPLYHHLCFVVGSKHLCSKADASEYPKTAGALQL
jgi:hypothetical protein